MGIFRSTPSAVLTLVLACSADSLTSSNYGNFSSEATLSTATDMAAIARSQLDGEAQASAKAWPWPDKKEEKRQRMARMKMERREAREEAEKKQRAKAEQERRLARREKALQAAQARREEEAAEKKAKEQRLTAATVNHQEAFGKKVPAPTQPPITKHLRYQSGFGEASTTTTTTTTTTTATTTTTTTTVRAFMTTTPWSNSTGDVYGRMPRVYFLFLAVDKISNLGTWEKFFAHGSKSQYRAFVHCKEYSCKSQVSGTVIKTVPTVRSEYCTDLVSPMNKLLSYALEYASEDTHPEDKFAFVSDSTLPAKPFQDIYHTLTTRSGSDFCVFPTSEWADIKLSSGLEMAPKFHQWFTLTRAHAEKASRLWDQGHLRNLMGHFEMNKKSWMWMDNSYADSRNFGCLDEFWHMAAIYGTLRNIDPHHDAEYVSLEHFTGGNLRISDGAAWQGECDTFVIWSKYMHVGHDNPFERLHNGLDYSSTPHGGNAARPGWWDTISEDGIKAIKNSDFLFVRKFIDNPRLAGSSDSFEDAYSSIMFT